MKRFFFFAITLLAVGSIRALGQTDDNWLDVNPEGCRCLVKMPGKPEKKEKLLNSAVGEVNLVMYMYQSPKDGNADNLAYAVAFMDYPADKITSDSTSIIKEFFDNAREGSLKAIQGKLLTESIINYKGYPGREQRVDFKNGLAIIKYRHYLIKNRLYTLQVITAIDNNFNLSINKFLDSFKLEGE